MIDENEHWYETLQGEDPNEIDFAQKGGRSFIDIEEMRNLKSTAVTSILAVDTDKALNESPLTLIHENHVAEAKLQHEKAKKWLNMRKTRMQKLHAWSFKIAAVMRVMMEKWHRVEGEGVKRKLLPTNSGSHAQNDCRT